MMVLETWAIKELPTGFMEIYPYLERADAVRTAAARNVPSVAVFVKVCELAIAEPKREAK